MIRTTGRALVAAATSVAALVAGVGPVSAAELEERASLRVFAHAVTPDRAVIAVDAGSGDHLEVAEVRDEQGRSMGRAPLGRTGQALVPVAMTDHSRKPVQVTLSTAPDAQGIGAVTWLTLSTERSALQRSPWRVVNKRTPLDAKDQPSRQVTVQGVSLAPPAARALATLLARARAHDIAMYPSNGFRSYGWQQSLYRSYVRSDGAKEAERFSARPGYSEHQTGLAVDAKADDGTCDLQPCFGSTPEGKFVARHADEAGFVVRYTAANRSVTGYQPEPWHLRYVGTWLAGYLQETRTHSLEEAFGMPDAASYSR